MGLILREGEGHGTSEIEGICAKMCSKLKVKIAFFSERMSNSWLYLRWNIKGNGNVGCSKFSRSLSVERERYFYSRCKYTPLAASSFEISTETHFHFLRKLHVEYVMNSYWISWKRNVGNGMRACNANFSVRREPTSSETSVAFPHWFVFVYVHVTFECRKFSLTFFFNDKKKKKKKEQFRNAFPKFNNRS